MASLFIANMSKQHHDFIYRLPEEVTTRRDRIEIGRQVLIGGKDNLTTDQIEFIVKQHEPYGLVHVRELHKRKDFVGLAYNVGAPVGMGDDLEERIHKNDEVMTERTQERHNVTATAVNENMKEILGGDVHRTEIETIEETKTGDPKVAIGTEVINGATQPRHNGRRADRRGK